MRTSTEGLMPAERKVLADVAEFGVHVVHVPEDESGPGFSFTVGLWHTYEQPEVIVFGLPEEVAHELLNGLTDDVDGGARFLAEQKHEDLLVGYPVRFVAVPKERYRDHLGVACWAYENADFPCVQLVWPDKQGRWPWDTTAREGFAATQPVLGRTSS